MSGGSLPEATTVARFEAVVEDEARLRPGVVELCRRLGIGGELVRFADGSLPVYAVGEDLVLKLYPPVHAGEAAVEAGVLDLVAGRLPVATPRVLQVGVRDGWAYVLMSRLRGRPLGEVWPALSPAERRSVAARVGGALAALHEVDHRGLDVLGPPCWEEFLAAQRAGCVRRQRSRGLPEAWVEQIPDFLDATPVPAGRPVLLHTEVMAEHVLVRPGAAGWEVSGLFDFEPAMRGAAEYEFAAVGLFLTRGDAGALAALLAGYGLDRAAVGPVLSRRFLAYALLHVYSDLSTYLRLLPAPEEPTLASVADRWFGVD
ncbi:phosphotransferase family protein [Actinoalloteichus caeruleus]|uniref:phosphotransferase family protein n=1 Tax=Actinoalloteichus cyanogriseus TaxID=2893586 RepID=UPI0009DD34C8|nr:aminoglycoside 3'-phosphotransferase/choline kinase family protein [Actinoalloteichus caeruleus]